jgi:hypothetical protein
VVGVDERLHARVDLDEVRAGFFEDAGCCGCS